MLRFGLLCFSLILVFTGLFLPASRADDGPDTNGIMIQLRSGDSVRWIRSSLTGQLDVVHTLPDPRIGDYNFTTQADNRLMMITLAQGEPNNPFTNQMLFMSGNAPYNLRELTAEGNLMSPVRWQPSGNYFAYIVLPFDDRSRMVLVIQQPDGTVINRFTVQEANERNILRSMFFTWQDPSTIIFAKSPYSRITYLDIETGDMVTERTRSDIIGNYDQNIEANMSPNRRWSYLLEIDLENDQTRMDIIEMDEFKLLNEPAGSSVINQVTFDEGYLVCTLTWSRDGNYLTYGFYEPIENTYDRTCDRLYVYDYLQQENHLVIDADETLMPNELRLYATSARPNNVSPDVEWFLYFDSKTPDTQSVNITPISGDGEPRELLRYPFGSREFDAIQEIHWLAAEDLRISQLMLLLGGIVGMIVSGYVMLRRRMNS